MKAYYIQLFLMMFILTSLPCVAQPLRAISVDSTGTVKSPTNSVFTFPVLGTSLNPDIDDAIDGKMSSTTQLGDLPDVVVEWTLRKKLHELLLARPVFYEVTNHTGTEFSFQYTNTPPEIRFHITGPATFSVDPAYIPGDDTWTGARWEVEFINIVDDDNTSVTIDSSIETSTGVNFVELLPSESVTMWIKWRGTNGTYMFIGSQAGQLSEANGGTANQNGVATAPRWTVYNNPFYDATNLYVNFGYGAEMADSSLDIFRLNTNIMFPSSSGRSPAAGLSLRQRGMFQNTNASGSIYILVRDEWRRVGFPAGTNAIEVPFGTIAELEWVSRGVNESQVTVFNRTVGNTNTITSGGGSPPTENTLTNGLIAYYNFEQTSVSTLTNAVPGGTALDLVENGGSWTKGVTGVFGNAWSNTVSTRVLSNDSSGLELGRAGASFSASYWYNSTETATRYMIGEYTDSPEFGWYGRLASGSAKWQFSLSANGTTLTNIAPASPAVTAGLHHVVLVFDNANDTMRQYVNGDEIGTASFAADVNDSDAPFTLGGMNIGGTWNSIKAMWDEVAIYNRAITAGEVELLYNGGSGTNLNLILNP
jgi:hypothetical protein